MASYGSVYYRQSTDGGATWSECKMLADVDPRELKGQYIPNLAVAPNGRVEWRGGTPATTPGNRSNDR